MVIFEDLHWVDGQTQTFLDGLVDSLPASRIVLLVNYRPEYSHNWGSKTYYTQIRLDTLAPGSTAELLTSLLGDDPSLGPLKELLTTRAGGNPLFLEESIRMLVESEVLKGDREAYHLAKPEHTIKVPALVQTSLAARIDRLPSEEKQLLQCAAVIGKDFPYILLKEIVQSPEEDLRGGLMHLQAAEFIYETNLFPDIEYTFKHALTHEVAYGSLLKDRKCALHERVVGAMERLYPDRLTEQIERLAHHAFRGEVWEKAAKYLRQAGLKILGHGGIREAVSYFEQGLTALKHLPETNDTREQAIDLHLALRAALFLLGELENLYRTLREAEAIAQNLGDRRRLGHISVSLGHYFWTIGDQDKALEFGERTLALAKDIGDFDLQLLANFVLGQAYHARGVYHRGIEHSKRNIDDVKKDVFYKPAGAGSLISVISRTWLVWSSAEIGRFAEGKVCAEEGVKIAETADHLLSIFHAYFGVGTLLLRKGEIQPAFTAFERCRWLCEKGHLMFMDIFTNAYLGFAHVLQGRFDEGITLLDQAVEESASKGMMFCHSISLTHLAEAYLLAGRIIDAINIAVRALNYCREYKLRGYEAWVLRLLGEIYFHPQAFDVQKSKEYYHQAQALANELGMQPLVAHCLQGLGKLNMKLGNEPESSKHLATATTMYREMGMDYWLAKTQELLGKEKAPMDSQNNIIDLVYLFQEAENRHDIDRILSIFADDAELEIAGLVTLVGREQIRAIFEYDAGVNTELRFFNFRSEGNTVTCQVVERNDRLKAAGFDELLYPCCSIVFRERLIQKFTFSPQAESIQNLGEVTRPFLPWVQKNYPLDYSKLFTPEGRFIYNRDNGERVVFLMKEWRAGKRE